MTEILEPTEIHSSNAGRKSKYTTELAKEICELIKDGVFIKDACLAIGVSKSVFYSWMNPGSVDHVLTPEQYAEFSDMISEAEACRKKLLISHITRAAKHDWKAAAWYLKNVYPNEFTEKQLVEYMETPQEQIQKLTKMMDEHAESSQQVQSTN